MSKQIIMFFVFVQVRLQSAEGIKTPKQDEIEIQKEAIMKNQKCDANEKR